MIEEYIITITSSNNDEWLNIVDIADHACKDPGSFNMVSRDRCHIIDYFGRYSRAINILNALKNNGYIVSIRRNYDN